MRLEQISLLNRNKLAIDYEANRLQDFFSYKAFTNLAARLDDIKNRTYQREQLVDALTEMNENWDAPQKSLNEIKRLKDDCAVVVIGGQQAGLLLGPAYTVNKLITIIKYAREQEKSLGVPVIPVFWIAGEDHDYDEINHVFSVQKNQLIKRTIKQDEYIKKSVSHMKLEQSKALDWLQRIFNDLPETENTKQLYDIVHNSLDQSETFVDFFARLIYGLFPNEGIVLVNSADARLRKLETQHFERLINRQQAITDAIYKSAQKLQQAGYSVQVDVDWADANLFYHDQMNERILLKRENGLWVGKHDEVALTTDEMLAVAKRNPEKLSNNVMTRPLMQEAVFPTLAFIAGDGEISYWALLKEAFEKFDETMKMPPIVPRFSFTFITERIGKLLSSKSLDANFIVNHGCEKLEMNWLASQQNPPVSLLFSEAQERFAQLHEPLQQLGQSISADLGAEAERNWKNIEKQLHYLQQRTTHHLERKYAFELTQFKEINNILQPNGQLQERVLTILPFINECGFDFITGVINQPCSIEADHYLVYLGG